MPHPLLLRAVCMGVLFLCTLGLAFGQRYKANRYQTTDRKLTIEVSDVFVRSIPPPTKNHIWYLKNKTGDVEIHVKFYTNVDVNEITSAGLMDRADRLSLLGRPGNQANIEEITKGIKTCFMVLNRQDGRYAIVYYIYHTQSKVLYESSAISSVASEDYKHAISRIQIIEFDPNNSTEPPGIPNDPKTKQIEDPTIPKGTVTENKSPTDFPTSKSNSSTEEVFWTPLKLGLVIGGGALLVISLSLLILLKFLKAGKSDEKRPRKKKKRPRDDEEEERPRKKKKVDYDDEEDERPKSKSKKPKETFDDEEEEDDDPPPRKPAPKPAPKGPPKPPPPKPKR